MTPPNKIKILSDGNELYLIEILPANKSKNTVVMYSYCYSKSTTKFGKKLELTEEQLSKLIDRNKK